MHRKNTSPLIPQSFRGGRKRCRPTSKPGGTKVAQMPGLAAATASSQRSKGVHGAGKEITVIFVLPDERRVCQIKLFLEILDLAELFLFIWRDGLSVRLAEVEHHLRRSPVIPSVNGAPDLVRSTRLGVSCWRTEPFPEDTNQNVAFLNSQLIVNQPLRPTGVQARVSIRFPTHHPQGRRKTTAQEHSVEGLNDGTRRIALGLNVRRRGKHNPKKFSKHVQPREMRVPASAGGIVYTPNDANMVNRFSSGLNITGLRKTAFVKGFLGRRAAAAPLPPPVRRLSGQADRSLRNRPPSGTAASPIPTRISSPTCTCGTTWRSGSGSCPPRPSAGSAGPST